MTRQRPLHKRPAACLRKVVLRTDTIELGRILRKVHVGAVPTVPTLAIVAISLGALVLGNLVELDALIAPNFISLVNSGVGGDLSQLPTGGRLPGHRP